MSESGKSRADFQSALKIEKGRLYIAAELINKEGRVCSTGCLESSELVWAQGVPFDMGLPAWARGKLYLFHHMSEEEVKALAAGDLEMRLSVNRQQQTLLNAKRTWIQERFGQSFGEKQEEVLRSEEKRLSSLEASEPYRSLDLEQLYLCIYANQKNMMCVWGTREECLVQVLQCTMAARGAHLDGSGLRFDLQIAVTNPYGFKIDGVCLKVGGYLGPVSPVAQESEPVLMNNIDAPKFKNGVSAPMSALLSRENEERGEIQNAGNVCMAVLRISAFPKGFEDQEQSVDIPYRLVKRIAVARPHRWSPKHSKREAWVPVATLYRDGYAMHLRRGFSGIYVLVKRPMEEIEHTAWFRFMESDLVSGLFFYLGRTLNRLPGRRKVALFNEKYSEKAEEGVFELFRLCRESRKTRCYFILDRHCPDYQRLGKEKGVVAKYSLKYYWLLFNVNFYISSEAPSHLTLMNSNNRYLRWNLIRHPFIFLQHGVTYLKRHGERSTYLKGKAGQADYVIVNSEKEQRIVSEMLDLAPSRIWNTGMLIFDQIEYGHINQSSPDKITVMLTWKQDEELLQDYEDSSYFQYNVDIYEMLLRYVDRSQINVVAHPRAYQLLKSTSIGDLVSDKPISEVLKESKLLITDYSSVCWNSFYQGGAVIFFQPDLEKYESFVGKLIPSNEEYVGPRVFDLQSLEQVIAGGIENKTIQLSHFRTRENEEMYNTINEHHDGKNTQRIYKKLKSNGFI